MTPSTDLPAWRLRNAWNSDSDRAVLALCARRLAGEGLQYANAATDEEAHAFKMHGFELVEAHRGRTKRLLDLREVAQAEDWATTVDPRAWKFMVHGDAVFGIPIAIHQSNCTWANRSLAAAVDAGQADLLSWLRSAARRMPKPLVVGREPWQIGILFETLYAERGPAAYRRALVDLDPEALVGEETVRVLEAMRELRSLTDDSGLDAPWRTLLQRIDRAEAGAMVMGDWVAAARHADVARVVFGANHVHVVDFFVPVVDGSATASLRAAALLTDAGFQATISAVKGSSPAVRPRAFVDPSTPRIDFPSFTFDQCSGMRTKLAVLRHVTEHFLGDGSSLDTAGRLATVAAA